MTFEVKRHIETNESYQGFNLTEFTFNLSGYLDNDQIAETFIRSSHFSFESLRDVLKNNPDNKEYLRCTFNIDKIKLEDFRKLNKSETIQFLIDFLNGPNWGQDKPDFEKLLDKYSEIHQALSEKDFYLISKDWFDKDDEKVLGREHYLYLFYFLILHIDRETNSLIITEWTYD